MKFRTFKGGIHPFEGKEMSMDASVKVVIPKGDMVYPLSQHIGAPAVPVVKVKDRVLKGQIIAEAGGFVSSNIICTVSGTVKKIEPRLAANGSMVNSIVVENDDLLETVPGFGEHRDYKKLSRKEILDIIKDAGIVGLGGAGFPTHVKLQPKNADQIEYVIVNGAECEPYLTSDYRMMMEQGENLVTGLKIILSLFDHAKGIIAIENNKMEAIRHLTKIVEKEENISVCPLKTKYPQGGERMLIAAVTGRQINSKMLPADAGCIVDNVDTVLSTYYAVCETTPLVRRIVTVTGDAIAHPMNFSAPIGVSYTQLLEEAGGFSKEPAKIISGGPMMGQALFSLDIPVMKNSSALTCLTKDKVMEYEETNCIRCGRCADACPEHLVPSFLSRALKEGDLARFEALNGMECCECGSCSYVCPARKSLTQSFKVARKQVMANRKKGGK